MIRCGSVHLFTQPAGGWAESSDSFQFSTCDRVSEGFGYSVDLDGDSVVMGVPQFQSSDEDVGIAYVLTRASGVWSESSTVTMISNPSGDSGDRFGFSVAIAGSHAIIGVPLRHAQSGAVKVFRGLSQSWNGAQQVIDLTPAGQRIGTSVDIHDDVVVVGAPFGDDSASGQASGALYVFTGHPPVGWPIWPH